MPETPLSPSAAPIHDALLDAGGGPARGNRLQPRGYRTWPDTTVTVLPVEIGALRWMPGLLIALVIQAPLEAGPQSPTRSEAAAGASP